MPHQCPSCGFEHPEVAEAELDSFIDWLNQVGTTATTLDEYKALVRKGLNLVKAEAFPVVIPRVELAPELPPVFSSTCPHCGPAFQIADAAEFNEHMRAGKHKTKGEQTP